MGVILFVTLQRNQQYFFDQKLWVPIYMHYVCMCVYVFVRMHMDAYMCVVTACTYMYACTCTHVCKHVYVYVILFPCFRQELGRLKELQFLELSENRLETLPAEMGNLTGLQDCYLSENLLTELPETLGRELLMLHIVTKSKKHVKCMCLTW